jgi:hypothetical protein
MTDHGSDTPEPSTPPTPPPDDVAELAAERDRLEREVERLKDRPARRIRTRRIVALVLVILTVVSFALVVPAAWGRRTVLDTDRYVATVAPLAADPAVQQSLAVRVTDAVFEALDIQPVIAEALPDRASFLAGPLTNAMRGFVEEQVAKVFASQAFQTFWVAANRFVHTQVLAVLDGRGETISIVEGKVLLNLLPLVNLALGQVQALATDLVGRSVVLPTVTVAELPEDSIAALESALGRDLPDRLGQIAVYDSNQLQALQEGVRMFERGVLLLALLLLVFLVGAIWVSPSRRRTILQLAVAAAVVLVVERRLAILLGNQVVTDVGGRDEYPAVGVLVDTLLASLKRYTGWMLVILLVTILAALLSGPYPWARSLRSWVAGIGPALAGAVAGGDEAPSPAAVYIAAHRDLLMLAGAVLVGLIVLLVDVSLGWLFVLALLLGLYELVVYRVARGVRGVAGAQPPA